MNEKRVHGNINNKYIWKWCLNDMCFITDNSQEGLSDVSIAAVKLVKTPPNTRTTRE